MRAMLLLLGLFVPWLPAKADMPPAMTRLIQAPPQLAKQSRPVQAYRFTVGRGTLDFTSGRLTEFRSSDQFLGYFFQGQGTIAYISDEPLEAAAFRGNISRNTSLRVEALPGGKQIVRESFKEAILWRTRPFPGLADSSGEVGSSEERSFQELLQRFHPAHPIYPVTPAWAYLAQALALANSNEPEAEFLWADVAGKEENLKFIHDASAPGEEHLAVQKVGGYTLLSRQPVGWSTRDVPVYPFILSHVDLDLTAPGERLAKLKVTETLTPTRSGLTLLILDLMNALGKDRMVHLRSVQLDGKAALRFHHEAHRVLIELPKPTVAFEPVKLTFEIEGDLIYEPPNATRWQLGLWSWFPQPEMGAQCYTVHAVARVRSPYVPIMPGTWIRHGEENGFSVLETRIDNPIQFFVVDAGRFKMHENRQKNRLVRVWTYHTETHNTERLGRLSHKLIDFYESLLGPFPFDHLNLIQVQSYGFGQAPPGTVYITREAFDVLSDDIARAFARGVNDRIAHEIAHQWWGHVVKMATAEDQWVTEAFAEFTSGLAMLNAKGKGRGYFMDKVKAWERDAKEAGDVGSIAGANLIQFSSDRGQQRRLRTQLLYDKGAFLLYDLQQKLGEEAFNKFLVNIPANIQWRFVSVQNLLDLLKAISGNDYSDYFRRYLWGTEMPDGLAPASAQPKR